ncbi:hypothetical protein [Rosistilla oblonga]|uniref:hypothetical protein n=1 Tax=Rosistilla oblonga TaxID=2527990 RepID=UPI003A97740A
MFSSFRCGISACLLSLLTVSVSMGQSDPRPTAPRLLPSDSLAYFRIDDTAAYRQVLRESSAGRMAADPQVRPLVSQVYTGAQDLFANLSEQLGVTLDELLAISQGELSVALVPSDAEARIQRMKQTPADGDATETKPGADDESPEAIRERLQQKSREQRLTTRLSFGVVAIIESGDQTPVLRRLLETAEGQMTKNGFRRTVATEQDVEIVSLQRGNRPQSMHYLIHEDTLVIGSDLDSVRDILMRWKGSLNDERLSGNSNFTTVMSHCVGTEETRPQLTFYVDPYGILDKATVAGGGAGMVLFIIQNLGLEGIKGGGGSIFTGGKRFETISHVHLLLDPRRGGVLSVVRPQQGPVGPPSFVPADATGFMALNWEVEKSLDGARRVYDQIRGAGSFNEDIFGKANRQLKVDLQTDLISQLTGRFTTSNWLETPARFGSQVNLFGAQLKDPVAAEETLGKAMANLPDWNAEKFAGVTLYAGREAKIPEAMQEYMRSGQPHIAIVGDHLVYTDSRQFLEQAIKTETGNGPGSISNLIEYDLIAGELSGQLDGRPPFMFSFTRPEESFRAVYEMLKAPPMREGLRRLAENNPVAKMFHQALEDNDLPPLSVFTQYMAPAGSFAYDDTSGLHMASFGLKSE